MAKIAVIIATINRSEHLKKCVNSILRNNYNNFEIVIVDQGIQTAKTKDLRFNDPRIKYFKVGWKGKSRALNYGIEKSSSDVLAFTDDDCVVASNWLYSIVEYFRKHKNISLLTGFVTRPSNSWFKDKNIMLPDYRLINHSKRARIFFRPSNAATVVTGNNMAFRKTLISEIGYYKTWLSPGTNGYAGEDTEIAFRCILNGHKIAYFPQAKVYHLGFVERNEFERKELLYFCGYVSVYCYLLASGYGVFYKFLFRILVTKVRGWIKLISRSVVQFHPRNTPSICLGIFRELLYIVKAISLPIPHILKERYNRIIIYSS